MLPKVCWLTSHAKHKGSGWGFLALLAPGSQLSEYLLEGSRIGAQADLHWPPARERQERKADKIANMVRAIAMEMCLCLPHGWLWIAHTRPHLLKTKEPRTHATQDSAAILIE